MQSSWKSVRMSIFMTSKSYIGQVGPKTRSLGLRVEKTSNTLEITFLSSWLLDSWLVDAKILEKGNQGIVNGEILRGILATLPKRSSANFSML